jgi:Ca2+-binding EF-hand superfamily protein
LCIANGVAAQEFSQRIFGLIPSHTLDRSSRNVVERIKAAIIARAGGSGVHALTRVLRSMDQDGSKTLDKEELQAGLKQLGCELHDGEEMRVVMRHFDKDGSGRISIEEFLRGVKSGMSYERKLLVKEAFSRLDRSGDGYVAVDDIMTAYNFDHHPAVQAGTMSEEDAAREFLSVFEGNSGHQDGIVTWSEFLDYYRVSHAPCWQHC